MSPGACPPFRLNALDLATHVREEPGSVGPVAPIKAPATALARSSCAPGAWSIESRPPRAVRRLRPRCPRAERHDGSLELIDAALPVWATAISRRFGGHHGLQAGREHDEKCLLLGDFPRGAGPESAGRNSRRGRALGADDRVAFLRALRSRRETIGDVPAIVLTAYGSVTDRRQSVVGITLES